LNCRVVTFVRWDSVVERRTIQVRRIAFALGAEVSGCNLGDSLDEEIQRQLRDALVAHQVLVFRDQKLAPEQLVRVAKYFGPLASMRDEKETLPGHPEVIRLSNAPNSMTRDYGNSLHSDGLDFLAVPDGATFLSCVECPALGGDTSFANMYLAYETLTRNYQKLLADLWWHVPTLPQLAHPAVRTHPQTGRPHLYLPSAVIPTRFCGMSPNESRPILRFLFDLRSDDRFAYRHRWRVNDLVVWENCATNHKTAGDLDHTEPRIMNRTRTQGTLSAIEVDRFSGDPIERPIEPGDVLRLTGRAQYKDVLVAGAQRRLIRLKSGEQYPVDDDSRALVEAIFNAGCFVARDALAWCPPEATWEHLAPVLSALRHRGVLFRHLWPAVGLLPPP
jgi:taurine dioxygenase